MQINILGHENGECTHDCQLEPTTCKIPFKMFITPCKNSRIRFKWVGETDQLSPCTNSRKCLSDDGDNIAMNAIMMPLSQICDMVLQKTFDFFLFVTILSPHTHWHIVQIFISKHIFGKLSSQSQGWQFAYGLVVRGSKDEALRQKI